MLKEFSILGWGFQWENVWAGAGMLLLGGVALVGWFLDSIIVWAVVIAILGACGRPSARESRAFTFVHGIAEWWAPRWHW